MERSKRKLPVSVEIDGKEVFIRNRCDYDVVLDVIEALNNNELDEQEKIYHSLFIFYETKPEEIEDVQKALDEMMKIINIGEEIDESQERKPQLMDWNHDFQQLAPPISRVLGYSVRDEKNYTHWWDFVGAFHEIGECTFSTIVSIRSKKAKGKKLEDWEQEFYRENKKLVDLPMRLTAEEEAWLSDDW